MNENEIQRGLEADARQVSERMPEKLTADEVNRVVERLRVYMVEHGLSRNKVARLLGVSRSSVYRFLEGKYKGNLASVVNKVVNLFNSTDRRSRRSRDNVFVETTIAKRIGAAVAQCDAMSGSEGRIALIVGDAGHGKSVCLRQYVEANKNAVYVCLDETMSSTAIFSEIAKRLKVTASGSLSGVARRVVEELKCRHTLIVLDEGSGLSVKQLNQLRQILVVKAGCPLVLSGNSDLLKTIMRRDVKKGSESLDQFVSRLVTILNLDDLACDKGGGLYTAADIRKLYEYGGISLTTDAVDTLKRICMTARTGRLRTCTHLIAALHTSRLVREAGIITGELVIQAITELNLPVRVWLPLHAGDVIGDTASRELKAHAG